MSFEGLISKEELMGGLPARRASMSLFAIENRTAQLVMRSSQATATYLNASALALQETAFLEAMAAGRSAPVDICIQDLERFAPEWADLVPEDAGVRAAISKLIAQKYSCAHGSTPDLRDALGLETESVKQAYQKFYGVPLDTIYKKSESLSERLRWFWRGASEWLESLPPFWVAFALTLPVGPGLLALPIAMARIGTSAAIFLLVLFGLINMFTAGALAEVAARTGITRFGLGYLGQLVNEYLGNAGSLFLSVIAFLNNVLVLVVFYIGVGGTLEVATGLPAEFWLAVVFGVGMYFLSRKSMKSTVAFSLLVSALNVLVVILIPLFLLPYIRPENLSSAQLPFFSGEPFDPGLLSLVLGVLLTNFFSHMLVANYGQVILRREPTGRAWIRGSMASIAFATLISVLWVVTVNGAIDAQTLAGEAGTALVAIARLIGPQVQVFGTLFVILSLGMATIHISLGTYYLLLERLPAPRTSEKSSVWAARGRFLLLISPIILVFIVSEWMTVTGKGSFSGLLGFVGVISLPLLGGIFPVLLLASSRRKGEFVPDAVIRLMGNPVLLGGIYVLFVGSMLVYGIWIYQGAIERTLTIFISLLIILATFIMLRRGAMRKRLSVTVIEDRRLDGNSQVGLTLAGERLPVTVTLGYAEGEQDYSRREGPLRFASLQYLLSQLPQQQDFSDLKVWAQRLLPEGGAQPLEGSLILGFDGREETFSLADLAGTVSMAVTEPDEIHVLKVIFDKEKG